MKGKKGPARRITSSRCLRPSLAAPNGSPEEGDYLFPGGKEGAGRRCCHVGAAEGHGLLARPRHGSRLSLDFQRLGSDMTAIPDECQKSPFLTPLPTKSRPPIAAAIWSKAAPTDDGILGEVLRRQGRRRG